VTVVELRGTPWAVTRVGDGAPDALFVHGFQNDHHAWDPLAEALAADGSSLLLVDLPGCGDSPAPPTWERATIVELAADLAVLAEQEGRSAPVLIGHSLGGAIALQMALDRPGVTSGLVLFAPASTRGLDFVPADQFERLVHPTADDQRALLRLAFAEPPEPAVLAAFEATIAGADARHIEGAARSMRDFDVERRLETIHAPALVIVGDRDRHVPLRNHLATWAHLRRAGLHVMHGIGHVPFREDEATSIALVRRFLAHERQAP
jgi:pimeloyl-ACP methyl ester carboxylesterase